MPASFVTRHSVTRRVIVLFFLYTTLVIMLRSAEMTSLSLFLGHLGVTKLPYTFLLVALVDIPLAALFLRLASAVPNRVILAVLALVMAALAGCGRLLMDVDLGAGLFLAYTSVTVITTFVMIQWGVVLLDYFTVEESRRAFPLIFAGAHMGGLLSGLAVRQLAGPLGTRDLVFYLPAASAALAVILVVAAGRIEEGRAWRQGESPGDQGPVSMGGLANLGLLGSSPLLASIAFSTAAMVLLRLFLRYSSGAGFEEAFEDPDELARFIGTYTVVASVVGIGLQVLAAPPLLRRMGVGPMNVVYAVLTGLAFCACALLPGLYSAAAARFTDQDLKNAIKTPLSAMFYEAMDEKRRGVARAIILGVVSPVSSLVSSLLLVAIAWARLSHMAVALAGASLSVLFVAASWLQARAYRREMADHLLAWMRERGQAGITLERAIAEAEASGDKRMADMARELRIRR